MGKPSRLTTPEMMKGKMVTVPFGKGNDINYNDLKPAFSFEYVQPNYCLSKWDNKKIRRLIEELGKFELHTWKQIQQDSVFRYAKVKDRSGIRVPIPRFVTPDVDIYYMKPFGSGCKHRVFGIREGHNFKFLWFDSKHEVYPGGY